MLKTLSSDTRVRSHTTAVFKAQTHGAIFLAMLHATGLQEDRNVARKVALCVLALNPLSPNSG